MCWQFRKINLQLWKWALLKIFYGGYSYFTLSTATKNSSLTVVSCHPMGPTSQSAHTRYLIVFTVLENPTLSKSNMSFSSQQLVTVSPSSGFWSSLFFFMWGRNPWKSQEITNSLHLVPFYRFTEMRMQMMSRSWSQSIPGWGGQEFFECDEVGTALESRLRPPSTTTNPHSGLTPLRWPSITLSYDSITWSRDGRQGALGLSADSELVRWIAVDFNDVHQSLP